MERLKPYPAYRDSGIPWLGKIPKHWETKKVKHVATILRGMFTHRPRNDPRMYNGAYPFIQTGDVASANKFIQKFDQTLSEDGFKVSKMFPKGTLVMTIAANVGDMAILDFDACFPDSIVGFVPAREVNQNYLYYLFAAMKPQFMSTATINTQLNLNIERIGSQWIVYPPLKEQYSIGEFLDRETKRLDMLVSKKEQLITLLEERYASLITRTVTKGLNPTAPVRDSCIVWLGKIPKHWAVLPLKRIAKVRYGLGQPPPESPTGLPLIRATNIKSGRIYEKDMLYVDSKNVPESRDAELAEGEIIVVRSGAYTGDSAIIPAQYAGAIAGYDMVVTVKRGNDRYMAWQILSDQVRHFQFQSYALRAAQAHLNAEELQATILVFPPEEEQKALADYLDRETSRLNTIISRNRNSIAMLREYRTALISAVVTGSIAVNVSASH